MHVRIRSIALALVALLMGSTAALAQEPRPPEALKINVGDQAPDFTLLHYDGKETKAVSLSDFRGKKNVIVAFFVFAFTGG